ncbi:MAG: DUF975 family protein [Clostridiales bacterium]|jgi:hypothetical protein|nr:DUF975 family protein [Clostridiales bacterium]
MSISEINSAAKVLVKGNKLKFFFYTFLAPVIIFVLPTIGIAAALFSNLWIMAVTLLLFSLVASLLLYGVSFGLNYNFFLKIAKDGKGTLSSVFGVFKNKVFLNAIAYYILISLLSGALTTVSQSSSFLTLLSVDSTAALISFIISSVLLIAVSIACIVVSLKLSLVPYIIADRHKNIFDSIKESWSIMKGNCFKYIRLHLLYAFQILVIYILVGVLSGVATYFLSDKTVYLSLPAISYLPYDLSGDVPLVIFAVIGLVSAATVLLSFTVFPRLNTARALFYYEVANPTATGGKV